jgi:photosystem II stability/assembly factor-like uncharacterized protein
MQFRRPRVSDSGSAAPGEQAAPGRRCDKTHTMMLTAATLLAASTCAGILATASAGGVTGSDQAGTSWDRIGPWNIFDGTDPTTSSGMGESGTLASAASPKTNPDLIYAGGQNNGVSSGVLKTIDGGVHWTRESTGLWDTRVLGVWIHPDDPQGSHVFAGTHSGIYESTDGAASWQVVSETASWGAVMSFRQGVIQGKDYIIANCGSGYMLTRLLAGGKWEKIKAPGGMAPNMYLSVVTTAGVSEVLTCIGGWGGGKLYYGAFDSPSKITWEGPLMENATTTIDCANAAVNPNDRNHFVYSKAGEYKCWHSEDGGKTVQEFPVAAQKQGVYFVMIDKQGDYYTATQSGAFVSQDRGNSWDAFHVRITRNPDHEGNPVPNMDRVPHDYQNIIPDFRDDQIAFPSDQGLHIVDRKAMAKQNYTLISACGDLHNSMSLSAIISPSKDGKSRNIVSNIWDWDVAVSWDDGKSWKSWTKDEKDPNQIGEGGGGSAMGASGHVVMFHRSDFYASSDGGHNWNIQSAPGSITGGFDYIRAAGSRTDPAGPCFVVMKAPADTVNGQPLANSSATENTTGVGAGIVTWLGTSSDFGNNYTWAKMPVDIQATGLYADPTSATDLFAISSNCLSHSTNLGKDWSLCSKATGLTGPFQQLIIKDSTTMFMLRGGAAPLRTKDSGKTWTALAIAPASKRGLTLGTPRGSLSWSGKTLVVHGVDRSAISRNAYGTAVWKSTDDGETWVDETGDLVTISPGSGVWYDTDFYLVSSGEGITVKRDFEHPEK